MQLKCSPGALEERGIGVDGLAGILKLVARVAGRAYGIYNRQLAHARQIAVNRLKLIGPVFKAQTGRQIYLPCGKSLM